MIPNEPVTSNSIEKTAIRCVALFLMSLAFTITAGICYHRYLHNQEIQKAMESGYVQRQQGYYLLWVKE